MKAKYIQISGIVVSIIGLATISFLYISQPRTLAEVTTKSQVVLGTYEIDRAEFEQGLADFRSEKFPDARAAFDRADPEKRDAATQFYIAYSFYRQGWGRLSNDDVLFTAGIAVVNRVIAMAPTFRSTDETLVIKTAAELKNEFEEGLKITPADFNPFKLTRERK